LETIEKIIDVNGRGDVVTLIPLGDIHLGTPNCDEEMFAREVEFIKNKKNCYWLGMGDYGEFINTSDPRWENVVADWISVKDLGNLAKVQADKFLEYVYPIRHKCIGVMQGNHEEKVYKKYHFSVTDYIAVELGVPNLTYCCMIRLVMRRPGKNKPSRHIDIWANHGTGGGHYVGSKINKLIRMSQGFDATIYLMGHVHDKMVREEDRIRLIGKSETIREYADKRYFILTGTFLRSYVSGSKSYGERKMYNPTSLGTMHIKIKPFVSVGVGKKHVELPPEIRVSQ
jgi:hypothetical protein